MAMSNAERQAKFYAKHKEDPNSTLQDRRRIQNRASRAALSALARLHFSQYNVLRAMALENEWKKYWEEQNVSGRQRRDVVQSEEVDEGNGSTPSSPV